MTAIDVQIGQRPDGAAGYPDGQPRMGFFTDTSVCIGCKACEVACKQWNDLPADGGTFRRGGSYDSTGELGANTWRHVRFVEVLDQLLLQLSHCIQPPHRELTELAAEQRRPSEAGAVLGSSLSTKRPSG